MSPGETMSTGEAVSTAAGVASSLCLSCRGSKNRRTNKDCCRGKVAPHIQHPTTY